MGKRGECFILEQRRAGSPIVGLSFPIVFNEGGSRQRCAARMGRLASQNRRLWLSMNPARNRRGVRAQRDVLQRRGEARADAISPQAMHRDTSLPARSDGVWQQQPAAEIDGVSEHHSVIFCSETAVQELTRFLHRSRRDTRSSHARWYVAAAANSRNRRCLRAPHSGGARTFSRNPILSSFRTWRQHPRTRAPLACPA